MTHRITFSRNSAQPFDDSELRRLAVQLKADHGILATVPYELHAYAADRLDRLARAAGGDYVSAHENARRNNRHLAFLATCERSGDPRAHDVTLTEDEE